MGRRTDDARWPAAGGPRGGRGGAAARPPQTGPALSRRQLIRGAVLASAACISTTYLAGCGPAGRASPQAASAVQQIPVQLHVQATASSTLTALVQGYLDEHFNATHKGIRAVYQPWGNMPAVLAATVAGQGPWVIAGCCYDFATVQPFLAPLGPYFTKDNINPAQWSAGQIATYRTESGLYAVPGYTAAQAYFYRQDILDAIGQPYPAPDWTYTDAARLWSACTTDSGGQHRYGATLSINPGDIAEGYCYLYGFGGAFMDASRTRCLLDQPASIRGGEWAFSQVWDKVCTSGNVDGTGLNTGIATGEVVFCTGNGAAVLWAVENLKGAKWDFLPFPAWPVRRAAGVNVDFYGMNAMAPNQELAWELFRFATLDPGWTRYVMRITLQQPALVSQWEEWEAVVRAAAPVLKTKALRYWREAAVSGEGYGVQFFKYQPLEAISLLDSVWSQIWAQKLDVTSGFRTIAQQIDKLESVSSSTVAPTGAEIVAAAQKTRRRLGRMFAAGT